MFPFPSRVSRGPLASTFAGLLALSALSTGCAPSARHSVVPTSVPVSNTLSSALASAGPPVAVAGTYRRNTILKAEFSTINAATAHDLVRRLRPEFLRGSVRPVAVGSYDRPVVYLDAVKAGTTSALEMIPASAVMEITYVQPMEALLRYGPTHGAGAIVVRTKR